MISIAFIHLNRAEHQLQEIRELSTTATSALSHLLLGKITWRATTLRRILFSFCYSNKKNDSKCVPFFSDLDDEKHPARQFGICLSQLISV